MKARVLFATGYEEVEALTVVDLLRRAGVECLMVSADDQDTVTGARGMEVTMDEKISEINDQCDLPSWRYSGGSEPQGKSKGSGHGQGAE